MGEAKEASLSRTGTPTSGGALSRKSIVQRSSVTLREAGRRSTVDIGLLKSQLKSISGGTVGGARRAYALQNATRASTKDIPNMGMGKRSSTMESMHHEKPPEEVAAEETAARAPPPPKVASVTENAPLLASKYHIELTEVKNIMIEFDKAKRNADDGYDFPVFVNMCGGIFDVQNANEDVIQKIYAETNAAKHAKVEKFLEWYMLNLFSCMAMLTATPEKARSEKLISELATNYGVSSSKIDGIKREFDKYDADHSGLIDKDEFGAMLKTLLKAKDSCDLSSDRIKKFWCEIDHDGSGEVDFTEFAQWYLKYFDPELTDKSGSCNLIEAFYASFNPEHQRRRNSCQLPSDF